MITAQAHERIWSIGPLSGLSPTRKQLGLSDLDPSRNGEASGFLARKTACPATGRGLKERAIRGALS